VLGAQVVDMAWCGLVLAGVEKDEPGSQPARQHAGPVSYMPYTHGLPAARPGSLAGWACALLPAEAAAPGGAIAMGLVVLSHWGLDFLVHRPDLPLLAWSGPKVGLGWWNYPVPSRRWRWALLAMAATAWGWRRGLQGHSGWSTPLFFIGLLVFLQLVSIDGSAERRRCPQMA
jgi:hypothetical protein